MKDKFYLINITHKNINLCWDMSRYPQSRKPKADHDMLCPPIVSWKSIKGGYPIETYLKKTALDKSAGGVLELT